MDDTIYILLPVHNRKETTKNFVDCLKKQHYKNFELVLIDDGSTDGTAEHVKQSIKNVNVIKGNGDWWWSASLNEGINYLEEININDSDIILIINDDVSIDADFLYTGLNLMKSMSDTLLLAQYRDERTGEIQETGIEVDFKEFHFKVAESKDNINCLSTRGLFLLWGSMKKIGKFNSIMLPHYGSDYEYSIRALKRGFKLKTDPSLFLIDKSIINTPRELLVGSFKERIFFLFNRRYVKNPKYWTNLVILLCPWYMVLPNIMKLWIKAILSLFVQVR